MSIERRLATKAEGPRTPWVRRALGALLMVAAVGCVGGPPRHKMVAAAEVAEEVRVQLRALQAAQIRRSAEEVLGLIDPSLRMLRDGVWVDYATCAEELRQSLPGLRSVDTRFDDIEIQVLTPDLALSSMVFHDEIVDGEGQTVRSWGPTTLLWRRIDGRWRVVFADADHTLVEDPPTDAAGGGA